MNAKPIQQFVQVPIAHYSMLATAAKDLTNCAARILSAVENQKSATKAEWDKLKANTQKAMGVATAEVDIGEITAYHVAYKISDI
jgi:hypothetical protein